MPRISSVVAHVCSQSVTIRVRALRCSLSYPGYNRMIRHCIFRDTFLREFFLQVRARCRSSSRTSPRKRFVPSVQLEHVHATPYVTQAQDAVSLILSIFSSDLSDDIRKLNILKSLQNISISPVDLALWNVAARETNNNVSILDISNGRIGKPGRKAVRDPNKPFQCNVCEYSSKSKSNFTIHMRTHTGEKPFACSECDYRTSQKGNLRIHKERRHGIARCPRNSIPPA